MQKPDIAPSFYQSEERDGFLIKSAMKRAWAAQLEILYEIDVICNRHGLTWFMDSGTLLGAAREGGYIPWDDDLDTGMMRADYELFKKYAREELPEGYVLANDHIGGQRDMVLSVKNCVYMRWDQEHLEKFHGSPYSLGVDIFAYDAIPDDPSERELYLQLYSRAFTAGMQISNDADRESCSAEDDSIISEMEKLLHIEIRGNGGLKQELLRLADQIAAMYMEDDTKDVTITWCCAENRNYVMKREWMERITYLPFEGLALPAPIGYQDVLKVVYGEDYMTPHRVYAYHDYPYFKDQAVKLQKIFKDHGRAFPEEFSI